MDDHRFDLLTRSLRSTPTRRTVAKLASAVFAGAVTNRLPSEAAAARCKKLKVKCKRKDKCCGGLTCGRKSTDHRCSSSLPAKNCCVPPNGKCKFIECECCGDYQCDNGKCRPS